MMKKNRIISFLVSAVMVMGMVCSCDASDEFKKDMIDQAEKVAECFVKLDYKGIKDLSAHKDEKLKDQLDIYSKYDDVTALSVREAIASTVAYNLNPDTALVKGSGKEGTVDVVFEVTDYRKLIDQSETFIDVDDFADLLGRYAVKKYSTVTMKFEDKDGEIVLMNPESLEGIIDFYDFELTFRPDFKSLVSDGEFVGSIFADDKYWYMDASSIEYKIPVKPDGQELTWKYTYTIEIDGETLYTSNEITSDDPEYLDVEFDYGGVIPYGECTIKVYDEYSNLISTSKVQLAAMPKQSEYVRLVCPEGDMVELEGADLKYVLSSGMTFRPEGDSVFSFANNISEKDTILCIARDGLNLNDVSKLVIIRQFGERLSQQYVDALLYENTSFAGFELGQVYDSVTPLEITVGDKTYPASDVVVYGNSSTIRVIVIQTEDDTFALYLGAYNNSDLDALTKGLIATGAS